jgi:site-specific DNA-methyltransferase (adenine-specific)
MVITNEDNMELMARYEDNYFDLAIVDPPYGIDITKMNMGGRKRNKEDKKKNWDNSVPRNDYFNELFRVSKNQIIWGGNYFSRSFL